MDWRVTPPRRVTSPTQGPPPPCKQALNLMLTDWQVDAGGSQKKLVEFRAGAVDYDDHSF